MKFYTSFPILCIMRGVFLFFINDVRNQDSFAVVSRLDGQCGIGELYRRVHEGEPLIFCVFYRKIVVSS